MAFICCAKAGMLGYLSADRDNLPKDCELRVGGTDNVHGQIFQRSLKVKCRLLCLLSFRYLRNTRNLKVEESLTIIGRG